MAHLRWQKPANGFDIVATAQIRWHRTTEPAPATKHLTIDPSPRILERATDRDADWEAAD